MGVQPNIVHVQPNIVHIQPVGVQPNIVHTACVVQSNIVLNRNLFTVHVESLSVFTVEGSLDKYSVYIIVLFHFTLYVFHYVLASVMVARLAVVTPADG